MNQTQRGNVIPAVSLELISLAERQDRFAWADCKDKAAIEPGTWRSLFGAIRKCYQCWENCTDLNVCQITLFIRSLVSYTRLYLKPIVLCLWFSFLVQLQEKQEPEYACLKKHSLWVQQKKLSCIKAVPFPISHAHTNIKNGNRSRNTDMHQSRDL